MEGSQRMYTGDAYIFPLAENAGRAKEGRVSNGSGIPAEYDYDVT